jgi:hypothetical protein
MLRPHCRRVNLFLTTCYELLHALGGGGFAGVDIALRIDGEIVPRFKALRG